MLFRYSMHHKILPQLLSRAFSQQADLALVTQEKGVRRITLNNPQKRNSLSSLMLDKLSEALFSGTNDVHLRCIVVDSKGPVFSSGHDLKELANSSKSEREDIFKKCSDMMLGIRKIPVPVIGVVKGLAAAAGCQFIASCDIVIAGANSKFSTPGASVGLFCSTPGVAVSRTVPQKISSYMLLTGNNISAEDAVRYGLVSKVIPEEEIEAATVQVLQSILSKSRYVLTLGKRFYYEQLEKNIDAAYDQGSHVMVENLEHREAGEGIKAFFEKRHPEWKHA